MAFGNDLVTPGSEPEMFFDEDGAFLAFLITLVRIFLRQKHLICVDRVSECLIVWCSSF